MKILFAAAEVAPFSKVGGLADVAGSLPRELAAAGQQLQVFSPLYRQVDRERFNIEFTGVAGAVRLGYTSHPFELFKCVNQTGPYLECLFIANSYFFDREGVYTDSSGEGFIDNNARYIFFQKALTDLIQRGVLNPDLIHVNDHHTALLPFLLHNRAIALPAILTVHNFEYQGQFSSQELELFSPDDQTALAQYYHADTDEYNALEIGLRCVDQVNTVSPTYARELLDDPGLSHGLHPVLAELKPALTGILNGADYSYWSPAEDQFISVRYDSESPSGKIENKKELLAQCSLPFDATMPVIGSVSRLVTSKGYDLISTILDRLVKLPLQLVFLGTGYVEYQKTLAKWADRYPDKIYYCAAFNEKLAHQIEAGADIFLMPSRFEPCGLNQIYSLRYGTVPIVHQTGGLADTVIDWNGKTGNGFSFTEYTADELLNNVKRAVNLFRNNPEQWSQIMLNGMEADYSWTRSANEYQQLYRELTEGSRNE